MPKTLATPFGEILVKGTYEDNLDRVVGRLKVDIDVIADQMVRDAMSNSGKMRDLVDDYRLRSESANGSSTKYLYLKPGILIWRRIKDLDAPVIEIPRNRPTMYVDPKLNKLVDDPEDAKTLPSSLGEMVAVWADGQWTKNGPWEKVIFFRLLSLIARSFRYDIKRAIENSRTNGEFIADFSPQTKIEEEADRDLVESWSK